jgi:hypothetical protein
MKDEGGRMKRAIMALRFCLRSDPGTQIGFLLLAFSR